jgi:hypothetical protein
MKKARIFALTFALATGLALVSSPAHGQVIPTDQPITVPSPTHAVSSVVSPVIAKVVQVVTFQHPIPEGSEWLKAEVIHADAVTLIVRERVNGYAIHTFNFTTELQPKMQAMIDKGGFQYGDRVSILYMQDQKTVALRVHGRPSKSQ